MKQQDNNALKRAWAKIGAIFDGQIVKPAEPSEKPPAAKQRKGKGNKVRK